MFVFTFDFNTALYCSLSSKDISKHRIPVTIAPALLLLSELQCTYQYHQHRTYPFVIVEARKWLPSTWFIFLRAISVSTFLLLPMSSFTLNLKLALFPLNSYKFKSPKWTNCGICRVFGAYFWMNFYLYIAHSFPVPATFDICKLSSSGYLRHAWTLLPHI